MSTSVKEKTKLNTFVSFLWPSVLGMIVISAYTFTDTFVVGYALGRVGLSAIGIGTPIIIMLIALGYWFGEGGGAAYSVLMGEGNKEKARSIYTQSMMVAFFVSVLVLIIGNVFINEISYMLGATDENLSYVVDYNRYIIIFSPVIILNYALNIFMRNDGKPKVAMMAIAIGSISNIVLDILFVIVLNMGMSGASIATGLGSLIGFIINLSYIYAKKRNIRLCKTRLSFNDILRIHKNGFGPFIMEFSMGLLTFLYNLVAFHFYGELGISNYTIIMNWHLISLNLIVGVAQATQPLMSLNYGKGDTKAVKIFRKYGIISCLVIGVISLLAWVFGATPLADVFVENDPELLEVATLSLKVASPTYVFMAITIMLSYFYASTEKAKQSMIINITRGLIMPAFWVFIMPICIGKVGVWASIPLAESLACVVAIIVLAVTTTKEAKVNETKVSSISNNLIITISRQFGSGGRIIGEEVAKKLNIPCYNKKLLEFSADILGTPSEVIKEHEETDDGCKYGLFIKGRYEPISNKVFYAQSKVITDIASKSSAVIVGRCADYILKDYNTINVFINAPIEYRTKRVMEYENISEKDAINRIKESDKARKEYHDFYTSRKWGESGNYDLVINSSIGIDKAVSLICDLYNAKLNG